MLRPWIVGLLWKKVLCQKSQKLYSKWPVWHRKIQSLSFDLARNRIASQLLTWLVWRPVILLSLSIGATNSQLKSLSDLWSQSFSVDSMESYKHYAPAVCTNKMNANYDKRYIMFLHHPWPISGAKHHRLALSAQHPEPGTYRTVLLFGGNGNAFTRKSSNERWIDDSLGKSLGSSFINHDPLQPAAAIAFIGEVVCDKKMMVLCQYVPIHVLAFGPLGGSMGNGALKKKEGKGASSQKDTKSVHPLSSFRSFFLSLHLRVSLFFFLAQLFRCGSEPTLQSGATVGAAQLSQPQTSQIPWIWIF